MAYLNSKAVTEYLRKGVPNDKHPDGFPAKVSADKGLWLMVPRQGVGYWLAQVRSDKVDSGFTSRGLGAAYGDDKVSLAAAVEAREAMSVLHRAGNLPPAKRRRKLHSVAAANGGALFGDVLKMWLDAKGDKWSAKGKKARGTLARLSLASMSVADITSADALAALEGETPRQHADKRSWLADLFAFAKAKGLRTGDNPARFDKDTIAGFDEVPKNGHHAAIVTYDDKGKLQKDLPDLYGALSDDVAGLAARFAILTVSRATPVRLATWGEIDGDVWTVPAAHMKGDVETKASGKPHLVPLTPAMIALALKANGGKRGAPNARIFPGLGVNALLDAVKKVRPVTQHGMRTAFRKWAWRQAVPLDHGASVRDLAELSMAHKLPGSTSVERAYADDPLLDLRRPLMQHWSKFVTGRKA